MYLHENKELFETVISSASELLNKPEQVVEKDYYITSIMDENEDITGWILTDDQAYTSCRETLLSKN